MTVVATVWLTGCVDFSALEQQACLRLHQCENGQSSGDAGTDAGSALDAGDAGAADAATELTPDGGRMDAGEVDAGTFDGGVDAGALDAGLVDAGMPDAGQMDAGTPDAGVADAGPVDAGPTAALPFLAATGQYTFRNAPNTFDVTALELRGVAAASPEKAYAFGGRLGGGSQKWQPLAFGTESYFPQLDGVMFEAITLEGPMHVVLTQGTLDSDGRLAAGASTLVVHKDGISTNSYFGAVGDAFPRASIWTAGAWVTTSSSGARELGVIGALRGPMMFSPIPSIGQAEASTFVAVSTDPVAPTGDSFAFLRMMQCAQAGVDVYPVASRALADSAYVLLKTRCAQLNVVDYDSSGIATSLPMSFSLNDAGVDQLQVVKLPLAVGAPIEWAREVGRSSTLTAGFDVHEPSGQAWIAFVNTENTARIERVALDGGASLGPALAWDAGGTVLSALSIDAKGRVFVVGTATEGFSIDQTTYAVSGPSDGVVIRLSTDGGTPRVGLIGETGAERLQGVHAIVGPTSSRVWVAGTYTHEFSTLGQALPAPLSVDGFLIPFVP